MGQKDPTVETASFSVKIKNFEIPSFLKFFLQFLQFWVSTHNVIDFLITKSINHWPVCCCRFLFSRLNLGAYLPEVLSNCCKILGPIQISKKKKIKTEEKKHYHRNNRKYYWRIYSAKLTREKKTIFYPIQLDEDTRWGIMETVFFLWRAGTESLDLNCTNISRLNDLVIVTAHLLISTAIR